MSDYDTAQICLNGHIICPGIKDHPGKKQKYCQWCGSATITKCNHCSVDIPGNYIPGPHNYIPMNRIPPAYCYSCGKPFPWTEAKINALKELIDITDKLDVKEKEDIKSNINDIISETPRSNVAIAIIKNLTSKLTGEVRKLIVDVSAETIKRTFIEGGFGK